MTSVGLPSTWMDDPGGRYSTDLAGNAYEKATLRNSLNLASGGKKGEQAGQAVPGLTSDTLRNQTKTIRAGFK